MNHGADYSIQCPYVKQAPTPMKTVGFFYPFFNAALFCFIDEIGLTLRFLFNKAFHE
jgi:hypothetical protein